MGARCSFAALVATWRPVLLLTSLLLLLCTPAYAKDEPKIVTTEFDNLPNALHYFKDSNVILFQESFTGTIWRSSDAGATWKKAEGIEHDKAFALVMHEFDPDRAYILTRGNLHWKTEDKGETWDTFFTNAYTSDRREFGWLSFHAADPDRIIFYGMDCESIFCEEVIMYTTDGFDDDAQFLRKDANGCWWAKSSDLFTTGDDDLDASRILCIVRSSSLFSRRDDNRLLISDNYFSAESGDPTGAIQEFEPDLDNGNTVRGAVNVAAVKKYLLVATTSKNTDEMALFVSGDSIHWHRAVFPQDHRLNEEAYTVLESTNYSIQIDVMTSTRMAQPMGVILTSNSNGTYFTRNVEHTNRNRYGNVDFEKVSGIQGIFLVNQVDNWEDVEQSLVTEKKIKTKITFDDGRTFESVEAGDDELHLHSITGLTNVGAVFSSAAPGLVMGNGNRGGHLKDYWESRLYISNDAGRTWIEGPKGPHKYEFGDQGSVLLAIKDSKSEEGDVDELRYSLDHGKEWEKIKLPDGLKVLPWTLTTAPGSTSLKFVLTARSGAGYSDITSYIISIDFEGLNKKTCKDKDDMEDWYARVDDDGNPSCIMGQTQRYRRRKQKAECFVKQEFKEPESEFIPCECTDADFECDFNFKRDGDECKLVGFVPAPEGACKSGDPEETFQGSSGWRLIPGNQCKRKSGDQKDDTKEWKCSNSTHPPSGPSSGEVTQTRNTFEGDYRIFEKHYLERGENSLWDDETIIARPISDASMSAGEIYISHDHGKTWDAPDYFRDENIWAIATHPYVKDMVFFLTTDEKVFYTTDRGRHLDYFEAKNPPDLKRRGSPIVFHPDKKDWLIWHGKRCHDSNCYLEASLSTDRGDNWQTVRRYAEKCEFTGSSTYSSFRNDTQIVCLAREREDNEADNPKQLLYADEFPKYEMTVAQEDVKDFATMSEFIVVATENQTENTLSALTSINGRDYAPAHFPFNFHVPHQRAYTVLDSTTHAVNLFVVTEDSQEHRYGSILKSNSNGTSYVLSASGVNCNDAYFVDFEKMLGLEGIVLINTVQNPQDESGSKRLQSKISHNDGAQWAFLPPPETDVDGKAFECRSKTGDENCALHIHGYTERIDHAKTYSSESAVGLMFGLGNVGPVLGDLEKADTFMTTDGGLSWKMVKKGRWTWSVGDQGSIIVLAPTHRPTKTISYSVDEGDTWVDFELDTEATISDVTTLRSGESRNFLLWGTDDDGLFTTNLDFTGLTDTPCKNEGDSEESDYYIWSPEHPMQPNGCLFGHKNQYLRKKKDRQCYNQKSLERLYRVEDCECTRQDFEW